MTLWNRMLSVWPASWVQGRNGVQIREQVSFAFKYTRFRSASIQRNIRRADKFEAVQEEPGTT